MAKVVASDALGSGLQLYSGDIWNGNIANATVTDTSSQWVDSDTLRVIVEYDGGTYRLLANVDLISSTVAELDWMIWQNRSGANLVSITNMNLRFNPNYIGDSLFGGFTGGADNITGNRYGDRIEAGAGADVVYGLAGNDSLSGNAGNDRLYGGQAHDYLSGDTGSDALFGGIGRDTLVGGLGRDRLYGGVDEQRDVFLFRSIGETPAGENRDTIHDMRAGIDDISLAGIDANTSQGGNQRFTFNGTTARAHSVWTVDAANGLFVRGDVNGDRHADFAIFVSGVHTLTAGDFIL